MKILIPLTILVISFILYYLFAPSSIKVEGDKEERQSIPIDLDATWQKREESAPNNNLSVADTIKIEPTPKPQKAPQSSRPYLTLNDLRQSNHEIEIKKAKEPIKKSYDEHVFNHFKLILQQSSSTYYAKRHIVLNSRISSILSSNAAREKFRALISSDFGLDFETIDDKLRSHRLVWDWVTFLSP